MTEAEQVFMQDMKQKKTISHSAYKRPNRSKVLLPSDLVKDWKYSRSGRVRTYNMYDQIIPKQEFDKLPTSQAKAMLEYWRSRYTNDEIAEKMGIGKSTLWRLCKSLGIENRKKHIDRPSDQENTQDEQVMTTQNLESKKEVEGTKIIIRGHYSGERLAQRLYSLARLVEMYDKVNILMKIEEVEHEQE